MNEKLKSSDKQLLMDVMSQLCSNLDNTKLDSLDKNNGNSNLSTMNDSIENFTLEGNENIIMQNLNLSDEQLKLIVIGDKAVGKSLLIDKICQKNSKLYSPTQR
jgi:hypothetical protein